MLYTLYICHSVSNVCWLSPTFCVSFLTYFLFSNILIQYELYVCVWVAVGPLRIFSFCPIYLFNLFTYNCSKHSLQLFLFPKLAVMTFYFILVMNFFLSCSLSLLLVNRRRVYQFCQSVLSKNHLFALLTFSIILSSYFNNLYPHIYYFFILLP